MDKQIFIKVRDKVAEVEAMDFRLVGGNNDYEIVFDFDEDWDSHHTKTALFVFGKEPVAKVFSGNVCNGVAIHNSTVCYVGVFAGDIATTTPAKIECVMQSITDVGGTPKDPEPSVYNQIIALINKYIEECGKGNVDLSEYSTTEEIARDYLPQMQIIQEQLKPEAEENNGNIEFAEAYDRAYIRRSDGKDSFIPFTLHPERVDSIWELGESTPSIPLRKDDGQIEVAEPRVDNDAVPYSMVKELDSEVKEATSIAKGAQQAISFDNYEDMINAVNNWGVGDYPIGQNIYIITLNVPDLWVSGVEELFSDWQKYTYTSDADFIAELKANGNVYVGRYYISALEAKVKLTDYYNKAEIDAMIGDISSALDELHNYAESLVNGGSEE